MDERITEDTRILRTQGLLESDVAGDVIALDIQNGQCFGFNSVASAVWHSLERETSVAEICETLTSEFEVAESECKEAVIRFVRELHSEGLVELMN